MIKGLLLATCLLLSSCREKTQLQKSYAFSEKAGWYALKEGLKQNANPEYVPDYTKTLAMWDSAIKHSPYDARFYGLKAGYYERLGDYRSALDTYFRLFGRGITPAEDLYSAGTLYDSLGVRDSAVYFYRRALAGYRRELLGAASDTLSDDYQRAGRYIRELKKIVDTLSKRPITCRNSQKPRQK